MLCNAKAYKQTNKYHTSFQSYGDLDANYIVHWGELLNLYDPHFFYFYKTVILMPVVKFIKGTSIR